MHTMRNPAKYLSLIAAFSFVLSGATYAAEGPTLSQDLTAVLALLGLPCGQVVNSRQQGNNDYMVTCKDGNRYRVFQNAEGRVVAQKQ